MAKYVLDYETGAYEFIERDGFSIDRGVYTNSWDDSEYFEEEEEEARVFRFGLFGGENEDL